MNEQNRSRLTSTEHMVAARGNGAGGLGEKAEVIKKYKFIVTK